MTDRAELEAIVRRQGFDPGPLSLKTLRVFAGADEPLEPAEQAAAAPPSEELDEPPAPAASDSQPQLAADPRSEPGAQPVAPPGERARRQAARTPKPTASAAPATNDIAGALDESDSGEWPGYIKKYRKVVTHPVWTDCSPSVYKLFDACLFLAHWRAQRWFDGRDERVIPRGSFLTTYPQLAKFCRLSKKVVRAGIGHMEKLGIVARHRAGLWAGQGQIITVSNYETYQGTNSDQGTTSGRTLGRTEKEGEGTTRARPGHDQGTTCATKANKHGHLKPPKKLKEVKEVKRRNTPVSGETNSSASGHENYSLNNPPFNTLDPVTPSGRQKSTAAFDAWFEAEFWPLYPRKVAKTPARKAAKKAVKKHGAEVILAGLRRHLPALQARERQFVPYPATWLNEERWADEPEPVEAPPAEVGDRYTSGREYLRKIAAEDAKYAKRGKA